MPSLIFTDFPISLTGCNQKQYPNCWLHISHHTIGSDVPTGGRWSGTSLCHAIAGWFIMRTLPNPIYLFISDGEAGLPLLSDLSTTSVLWPSFFSTCFCNIGSGESRGLVKGDRAMAAMPVRQVRPVLCYHVVAATASPIPARQGLDQLLFFC